VYVGKAWRSLGRQQCACTLPGASDGVLRAGGIAGPPGTVLDTARSDRAPSGGLMSTRRSDLGLWASARSPVYAAQLIVSECRRPAPGLMAFFILSASATRP
jgi:hypothetical protein